MIKIVPITYETILAVWQNELWPARESKIEPISWINEKGEIDLSLSLGRPQFWGAMDDQQNLVGVCSGFRTSPQHYRSRGIWVNPQNRRQNIGKKLMEQIELCATQENCSVLWTMPRLSALPFYLKLDFRQTQLTDKYEFGPHALAVKSIKTSLN